jgi:hypothetical protein
VILTPRSILQKCAFGEISLTMTQLRAIEILLRKCLPNLAAAEISEQTHRYVVEIPTVLTSEQWLEKYGKCDKESDLPDKPDRPCTDVLCGGDLMRGIQKNSACLDLQALPCP